MSFINVEHLIFSYKGSDEIILKDINFTAEKGEIITILGPSGCGKSTLLKLLAGLQSPTKGKVQMNGQDIKSASLDRAFVFQNYG
ncbi:ATP-binding cassette domain-containing protein, partial [Escherichia coli]|nr:ATP-binding cassette domain-containing protein [Escherichia coli]